MTAVLKYGWFDKLDDKVNKYSNIYLKNMKPADIMWSAYIDSDVQNNDRKVGDQVKISKCKNIFPNGCTKNLITLCHGHMMLMISVVKKCLKHLKK